MDEWYLGVYIDAIEWVEMPNARGMSQFADDGIIATKPYAASGNYINKMTFTFLAPNIIAIWGATKPTKDIGPTVAVEKAHNKATMVSISVSRVFCSAYGRRVRVSRHPTLQCPD